MLATVASVTSANRIKRRSNEFGIYPLVVQTPHTLAKDGCGYSLRFEDDARMIIQGAASELGINIRAFYKESTENGKRTYTRV